MKSKISYRQKDGTWQYYISYKENGKWDRTSKQGFKTKAQAKEAATPILKELERQHKLKEALSAELINITFRDFAMELLEHEKLYKQPYTVAMYQKAFKKFKALHDMPVNKIKTIHIQKEINRFAKEGLKFSTIKKYGDILKYFFNQAIQVHEIIQTNPANKINCPAKTLQEQTTKIKALTEQETNTLMQELETTTPKHYPIFLVAVTTGLRISEILGITYNDIDFKKSLLNVNKQWKKDHAGKRGFGSPKSKRSNRKVPIPAKTIAVLLKHKNEQAIIPIDGRVFTVSYNILWSLFRKACKKLNLDITIHDLRHTYATRLIANGIDFKTVSELLGNDIKEVMVTYSHVNEDMHKRAVEIIEGIF